MTLIRCRSCNLKIGFIELTSGRKMTVDPTLVKTFGLPYCGVGPILVLVTAGGQVQRWAEVAESVPGAYIISGFTSHFATCSAPAAHRRSS